MRQTGWIVSAAVAGLVAYGGAVPAFAGGEAPLPAAATTKEVKHQTACPVMGGQVNTNLYLDAAGKRIYVCCTGCIGEVKKDPEKFIKKLEAEGITLDKTPGAVATNAPAAALSHGKDKQKADEHSAHQH